MREFLTLAPVIPVLAFDNPDHAVPMARAMVRGGLRVLEVTLRTPTALDSIKRIATDVPEAIVGAGTVLDGKQLRQAIEAGSKFLVSPGVTDELLDAAEATDVPLLPGIATASEAMRLASRGITMMKFFPAEQIGGVKLLQALGAPLPHLRFCPTGGINLQNAPSYLALPNVLCVGGSWVAPADAFAAQDWARIERLAAEAAALRRGTTPKNT
ncbi:MAG: keto-deoxy-phosphogluconate aldolase [Rhodospirillales bacterium]|nr:keto-deoxy-phosphogluconate aldolase [Rhodospirillales bacterium]